MFIDLKSLKMAANVHKTGLMLRELSMNQSFINRMTIN